MVLAYFVYFGLLICLVTAWFAANRFATLYPSRAPAFGRQAAIFSVIIFTLLIGCRYAVGGDFFGYIYYYQSTSLADRSSDVVFEPGFLYLIKLLKLLDSPDRSIIIASSFIQILLLTVWMSRQIAVSAFVAFFFVTIILLDFNNTVRQGIAIVAMMLAIDSLNNKKILQFALWGTFAYTFHRSALIIFPLGFLLWYFRMPKVYMQLTMLLVAYLSVGVFSGQVIALFERLSPLFGYEGYSDISRADLTFGADQASLNLGKYLWPLIDAAVIIYSSRLTMTYSRYGYQSYHALFLVAALLQPVALSWDFLPFGRALFYFTAMRMVCLAFLVRYCFVDNRQGRNLILGVGICAIFVLWLAIAVSRGAAVSSPYEF